MPDQQETGNPNPGNAPGSTRAASGAIPAGRVVGGEKRQFVIAMRRIDGMNGFQPSVIDFVEQTLRSTPAIELLERIGPKAAGGTLPDGMGGAPNVLVACMSDTQAEIVRQQSRGQLIVERDQPLRLWQFGTQRSTVTSAAPAGGPALAITVVVVGKDDTPVRDAEVYVVGSLTTARDVTDERGKAKLMLYGETADSLIALGVKPKSDYWSYYQSQPSLDASQPNLIFLQSLSDTFHDFPQQEVTGWGQRAMRLDQLPGNYRGQGAKVGLIDSGVTTQHVDLQKIKFGVDFVNKQGDQKTWTEDVVSHGSHAAGIIAGSENGIGIRGFAPHAELHACKIFPGGRTSHLIDAIEYCIEKQIDVLNLSVGGIEPSEALEQELLRAKRYGVACIVAAGNSAGSVEYPASSPHVLAVSAIGRIHEFPPDSYHAQTVTYVGPNGLFSPKFTNFGPEVALCAPGVAILSSVPPNNYAVRDGTSLAAAHVTGVAGLVIAHHADFQGPFKMRNSDRVDRLFQILKLAAQPLDLGDPRRTGFGVPDVLIALGLAPQLVYSMAGMTTFARPYVSAPTTLYNAYAYGHGPGGFF